MQIRYLAKNIELTASLKEYVDQKLTRLVFSHGVNIIKTCEVQLGKESRHHHSGNIFKAEVMLFLAGKTIRVEHTAETVPAAFDLCLAKLKILVEKHKQNKQTKHK